jgi:putative transcriptional regulator
MPKSDQNHDDNTYATDRLEGKFLIAMPRMGDQRFENTVIFLCAHSDEGAMGFIVNQPTARPGPLEFWKKLGIITDSDVDQMSGTIASTSLHTGGPVEPGRGFVLHSPDYTSDTTLHINQDVSLTATLEILRDLAHGKGPAHFLVALGYSGWSAGQLEEEIAANGWLVCPADSSIIFGDDDQTKYIRVMKSMGIDPKLISTDTGHA